jgi:hypothetical protein
MNKMEINFNRDFKKRCSEAFQYSHCFAQIMENLERNNEHAVRRLMDEAIDDLQLEINQKIGPDEHSIHNARVEALKNMYLAWYELIDLIDTVMEKPNDILRKPVN